MKLSISLSFLAVCLMAFAVNVNAKHVRYYHDGHEIMGTEVPTDATETTDVTETTEPVETTEAPHHRPPHHGPPHHGPPHHGPPHHGPPHHGPPNHGHPNHHGPGNNVSGALNIEEVNGFIEDLMKTVGDIIESLIEAIHSGKPLEIQPEDVPHPEDHHDKHEGSDEGNDEQHHKDDGSEEDNHEHEHHEEDHKPDKPEENNHNPEQPNEKHDGPKVDNKDPEHPDLPKEEHPEGPKEEHPEGPKEGHPEGPKEEHPEGPKEEHPEGPKEEHPEGPKKDNHIPETPKESDENKHDEPEHSNEPEEEKHTPEHPKEGNHISQNPPVLKPEEDLEIQPRTIFSPFWWLVKSVMKTLRGINCSIKGVVNIKHSTEDMLTNFNRCEVGTVKQVQAVVDSAQKVLSIANEILHINDEVCDNRNWKDENVDPKAKASASCAKKLRSQIISLNSQIKTTVKLIKKVPKDAGDCVHNTFAKYRDSIADFPSFVKECSKFK